MSGATAVLDKDPTTETQRYFAANPEQRRRILNDWYAYHRAKGIMHRDAQGDNARQARLLGVAAAVLSAVVGTSIFATIESSPATGWKIVVGLISVVVVVLGALQSTLNLTGQEAQHRSAAEAFGPLRRTLESWAASDGTDGITPKEIDRFMQHWNQAEKGTPSVPRRKYRKTLDATRAELRDHPLF